ncbi:MAG: D-alanine--D-alanine ligase [Flavobacteriales bacterium]|nr:D-alanine--D-alanine ligase [Flavobacteriales bacterium]
MSRPLVAVVRGGYSGESVISHQSAVNMAQAIDRTRFEPLFVTITQGAWACADLEESPLPFDRGAFAVDRGQGPERFVAALIAIHGTPGEDGKLQGYLDMLGVPYQTGGVLNMALTFSKSATTGLLGQRGFPVAPSVLLMNGDAGHAERVATLGYPCFVKPDQSGSSLGVSKVKAPGELRAALDKAFSECATVLVEAAVHGRELTCGVMEGPDGPMALPICEVRTTREFFDYEAKYHAADTEELVPAPIPDDVADLVQRRSAAIYRALDCRGLVRVDHFWDPAASGDAALVTIELNTVPGFSEASIFPKMLRAADIGVEQAINGLVHRMLTR